MYELYNSTQYDLKKQIFEEKIEYENFFFKIVDTTTI